MIKTIDEQIDRYMQNIVIDGNKLSLQTLKGMSYVGYIAAREMLKDYGKQVIEECAGSAEYSMEEVPEGEEGYLDMDGDQVYPVLVRQSIMDVIDKIV